MRLPRLALPGKDPPEVGRFPSSVGHHRRDGIDDTRIMAQAIKLAEAAIQDVRLLASQLKRMHVLTARGVGVGNGTARS